MPDIAVIVVNWNARQDLQHCLTCLFAEPAPSVSFGVYVVDNASSDGSADMVAEKFPQTNLVRNPDNRGFSKANNQAITAAIEAGFRYAYLLNSDAFVESPVVLDEIVKFGDEREKSAFSAPKC